MTNSRRSAAPFLAAGIPLTILGLALLGAALFNLIADPATDRWGDGNATLPLSWAGWVSLAVGLSLVSYGVYALVDSLERRPAVALVPQG